MIRIPGQSVSLQVPVSWIRPSHKAPLPAGIGSVQFLDLMMVPSPQVAEQGARSFQELQPPSTDAEKSEYINLYEKEEHSLKFCEGIEIALKSFSAKFHTDFQHNPDKSHLLPRQFLLHE